MRSDRRGELRQPNQDFRKIIGTYMDFKQFKNLVGRPQLPARRVVFNLITNYYNLHLVRLLFNSR